MNSLHEISGTPEVCLTKISVFISRTDSISLMSILIPLAGRNRDAIASNSRRGVKLSDKQIK